jgi:hypothetical protein
MRRASCMVKLTLHMIFKAMQHPSMKRKLTCCIDNDVQPRHCHSGIPSSMATCIKLVLETNGKETAMYLLLEHFP